LWNKTLAKWNGLDWSQRLVFLEAAMNLAAAQFAIRILPFRWIAPRLGSLRETSVERPIGQEQKNEAQQVGRAITILARYFPWDAKCLAQAVTGKWMLRRRSLPSTLYMGVNRVHGGEKWLEAHAWLRCGGEFVTGEPQHERFKVLATFTEDRL
jgi:hypothetical protein